MTTYNTGNPIGSTDARDLYDNAQNLDNFANGTASSYIDRLGVSRRSLAGIDSAADNVLNSIGYSVPVAYTSGISMTLTSQTVEYSGVIYAPLSSALPFTTSSWGIDEAKFRAIQVTDADLITYTPAGTGAVPTTVQSKLREFVSVKDFGAVGDGVTDDTAAIQLAIDSGASGVFFPAGIYNVSKTSAFSADFPNNDQPCLFIKNKTGLKLYGESGAKLITSKHAQGILELQLCSDVTIDGLEFQGAGNYPPLDGNTGRGEKGTTTEGYYTAGFWGYYKNNSLNTASNTDGGFGGAFPQFGGGTASSWGMWNGGYIGNSAYGVLIHNGCSRVTVSNCTVSDFNYVGIGVGHNGDYFPTNLGYADSTDIKFVNCNGHECYSANFHSMAVNGFVMDGCTSEASGHPDADPYTNTYADPGYGYTARGSSYSYTKNAVVCNNIVRNCVRKGLDSHASSNIVFSDNSVTNCAVGGIYAAWSAVDQPTINTTITGNIIVGCGGGVNTLGGIYLQGLIDADYSYANIRLSATISNNAISKCGGSGLIHIRNGRDVVVSNNVIRGYYDGATTTGYGILVGRAVDTSYQISITGNVIDATGDVELVRGIQVQNLEEGVVANNIIKLDHASANIGLYHIAATKTDYYGNRVNVSAGTPIAVTNTTGVTHSNYATGGSEASAPFSSSTAQYKVPTRIALRVDFNGTSSPGVTVYSGGDFVSGVVTQSTGIKINLTGIAIGTVLPTFMNYSAGGLMVGATALAWIYARSISNTEVQIGTKILQTSGSHTDGATITAGSLLVYLDVM